MQTSVCLTRPFEELNSLSDEQLKKEILEVLDSVGYTPKEIVIKEANRGVLGEIRVPVEFDEVEAMDNWMIVKGHKKMLVSKNIEGIEGEVLVKVIQVDDKIWNQLNSTKNPETQDFFISEDNKIEIPLNDFIEETCYGDVTFFADEINGAINDGAELLWVERKML